MSADLTALLVALAMSLAFFFANMHSGQTWLRRLTIAGFLTFAALASFVAFRIVWPVVA